MVSCATAMHDAFATGADQAEYWQSVAVLIVQLPVPELMLRVHESALLHPVQTYWHSSRLLPLLSGLHWLPAVTLAQAVHVGVALLPLLVVRRCRVPVRLWSVLVLLVAGVTIVRCCNARVAVVH